MSISLASVLPMAAAPTKYKLHLACWNQKEHPLDVFVRDREQWDGWNRWRGNRNDFTRPYILSFMDFYHEPDTWLFGGTYRVLSRSASEYNIELEAESQAFIGRLKVSLKRPARAKAFYLENYIDQIIVSELLKEPYSGRRFPGYESLSLDFRELEEIIKNARPDWKAALEHVKGVYLVIDRSNGKRYVGSAYGGNGIWSRWSAYVSTGHGWNDELTKLIKQEGLAHAHENFRFVLLEYRPMRTGDDTIIAREQYWKKALLSAAPLGYNQN